MTKIDRYILTIYFRVLVICFLSMAGLMITVHFFTSLDEFIEYGQKVGGLPKALALYYGPFLLGLFSQMSGALALLAIMFVISWLYRTNELTAILAAGVSKGRIAKPLILASSFVIVVAGINREVLIPQFAAFLNKSPQDLTGKGTRPMRPTFDLDFGVLISGRQLVPSTQEINQVIVRLEGPGAAVAEQITADTAQFVESTTKHPRGYILHEVRSPSGIGEINSVRSATGTPYVLTSKDTDWLQSNECFVASNLHYQMLNGKSNWTANASVFEISNKIRLDPRYYGADVRASLHAKTLKPISDMTLLLLGIPIVLTKPARHLFWVAGVALLTVGSYMGLSTACMMVAQSHSLIDTSTAAWLPILIAAPWAWSRVVVSMNS